MNRRSAIAISGALAVALLAGIVGANRALISSSQPQVVVRHVAARQVPQQRQQHEPTYTERE